MTSLGPAGRPPEGPAAPGAAPPPLRVAADGRAVEVLDQTRLPHEVAVVRLGTLDQAAEAITAMRVRGAPLIGITAAYGLWLALLADDSDAALARAAEALLATRPTAVNLRHAVEVARQAAPSASTDWRCSAPWAAPRSPPARSAS